MISSLRFDNTSYLFGRKNALIDLAVNTFSCDCSVHDDEAELRVCEWVCYDCLLVI